jgi:RNA polymerase sigma factor (sigma-70 family)
VNDQTPDQDLIFTVNMGYYARGLDPRPAAAEAAIRAGDAAYRILFGRYYWRLVAYAGRRGAEAEDAAQHAMMQLIGDPDRRRARLAEWFARHPLGADAPDQFLNQFQVLTTAARPDRSVRGYLFRIAHNRAIQPFRRPQPDPLPDGPGPADDDDAIGAGEPEPLFPPTEDEIAQAEQLLDRLTECRRELPDDEQDVIRLMEEEGLTGTEAAEVLGLSLAQTYRLRVRALARLAGLMCRSCQERLRQSNGTAYEAVDLFIARNRPRAAVLEALKLTEDGALANLLANVHAVVGPCRGTVTREQQELYSLVVTAGLSREEALTRLNAGRPESRRFTRAAIDQMLCGMFCTQPARAGGGRP